MEFNPKYHAVIKGWDALNRYCERRWKESPRCCEHFARIGHEVRIEKIEAKAPTDEYWTAYFLLVLPNQFGYFVWPDDVYKKINDGTLKPMKV